MIPLILKEKQVQKALEDAGSFVSEKIQDNEGIYDWLQEKYPERYKKLVLFTEIDHCWNHFHSVPQLKGKLRQFMKDWCGVVEEFNKIRGAA